jgi:hypothetical protein
VATEVARLFATVGANIGDFESKMKRVDAVAQSTATSAGGKLAAGMKSAGSAIASMAGLAGGLGVASLLALGVKAVHTATELAGLKSQIEMVGGAFEDMAGGGRAAQSMLATLRAASQGTISDYDLMLSANRAMMLGVAKNSDEMTRLLEVAMKRGQAMGLSTQQAFNDIVTGIGRASPMILDNLGIVINAEETYKRYAASIGVAADALTKAQQTRALTLAVTAGATGEGVDLGGAAAPAQVATAVANLRAEIAMSMEGWQALMQSIAEGAKATTERLRDMRGAREEIDPEYYLRQARMFDAKQAGPSMFDVYRTKIDQMVVSVARGEIAAADARAALDAYFGLMPLWAQGLASATTAQEEQNAVLELYGTTASRAALALGTLSAAERLLASSRPDWSSGTDAYGNYSPSTPWSDVSPDIIARNRKQWAAALGDMGGGAISTAKLDAERAASEYRSFVQGLLQPTQVTDADMAATQAGVYQDKWDEYMRRFRVGKNPYEIQQEERAFYGGQRMGEVNWDALIGAGREQAQYEAGQQNLLNTAMSKLAEAGVGLSREQVSGMLGLPTDYASVGAERSEDFAAGIANSPMGASVTTAFEVQLKAESERWIAAGENMADLFVEGFETGTAGALLQAIVDAVLPEVLEVVNA